MNQPVYFFFFFNHDKLKPLISFLPDSASSLPPVHVTLYLDRAKLKLHLVRFSPPSQVLKVFLNLASLT